MTFQRHAANHIGDGRTLCGLALEGVCDGSSERPPLVADCAGQRIQCPDCQRVIDYCRQAFDARYIVRVGAKP